MGNQMLALKERQPSHFVHPGFLKRKGTGIILRSLLATGSIYSTNILTELSGICSLDLFNPLSVSWAWLENSEEKLPKCSSRPGWGSAAGSCEGCSTQRCQITQRNGLRSEMAFPPLPPSVPLHSTQSPALAGC